MSDSPTALAGSAGLNSSSRQYQLSDDLAKLCLPQEWKDSCRTLAWVNSVCALFLMVGAVGFKAPKVIVKPLSEIQDAVPVVWTPPEEPPKPTEEEKQDEPEEQTTDPQIDMPQVVTVAAVDSPDVAFSVPVPGAVAVAPMARLATPPPPTPIRKEQPKPQQFNPTAARGEGSFPPPEYPGTAQRNRYQGTVVVEIKVANDGEITSASIYKSSGYTILDEAALQVVQRRWRFAPGAARWLHWPCTFKMP